MTNKQAVMALVLGLVLFLAAGIGGLWWKMPKLEVENQSSLKKFRLPSIWGSVYLWKTGNLFRVDRVKVIYTGIII